MTTVDSAVPNPVFGAALMLAELRESSAPPASTPLSDEETQTFRERLQAALAVEAEPTTPTTTVTRLRESAFPLTEGYELASLMRGAGTLWADSQVFGSEDDEAAASTIAKTIRGVIARHPEIVQLDGLSGCGCGPVCCC